MIFGRRYTVYLMCTYIDLTIALVMYKVMTGDLILSASDLAPSRANLREDLLRVCLPYDTTDHQISQNYNYVEVSTIPVGTRPDSPESERSIGSVIMLGRGQTKDPRDRKPFLLRERLPSD